MESIARRTPGMTIECSMFVLVRRIGGRSDDGGNIAKRSRPGRVFSFRKRRVGSPAAGQALCELSIQHPGWLLASALFVEPAKTRRPDVADALQRQWSVLQPHQLACRVERVPQPAAACSGVLGSDQSNSSRAKSQTERLDTGRDAMMAAPRLLAPAPLTMSRIAGMMTTGRV